MMTTLLNNRYQIIQVLAAGGFGETYLAEDTYMPSRRRCVIKQLKPVTNDPQMYQLIQQRFQREAATLEALGEGSDQIPKLYAYFLEDGQFHLVQEWIQGQTITDKVESVGPLSETAVKEILASLLLVLDYVHSKGIIYRDIKPDNIILRQANGKPVLIDFGAVKETMTATVNTQGKATYSIVLGTPGFMAPEQAAGRPIYASDIYSLGMTGIYLLTGKLPQELQTDLHTEEMSWQQHAPNVSADLAIVLNKAIQYHPRDRYTTAIKMLDALQSDAATPIQQPDGVTLVVSLPHELSSHAAATPQSIPVKRNSSKGKRQALLLGSVVIGSLVGVAVIFNLVRQQSPVISSQQPQSTSEQTIATTPTEIDPRSPDNNQQLSQSPAPAIAPSQEQNNNSTPSPASVTITTTPEAGLDPRSPDNNQQQLSQSPAPTIESPNQEQNNNSNPSPANNTIPGLPTGVSESKITAALGNPTKVSNGYYPNTRALLYELKPDQVSLGYIIDRSSGRLRQTEASFAQSVDPSVMQATLKGMLGNRALLNASQGLQRVYDRRTNQYSFNVGELQGVIERNNSDRIYIGVWDADLH